MCGLAGFLHVKAEWPHGDLAMAAKKMATALWHRGPDDEGVWVDQQAGIALGFRRLSILDLSPQGHQPMISFDGRYVIVFNGEIYNHQKLRRDLERAGIRFRGHSDTEVLLRTIECWGLHEALSTALECSLSASGIGRNESST